jgi:hypothetical protein
MKSRIQSVLTLAAGVPCEASENHDPVRHGQALLAAILLGFAPAATGAEAGFTRLIPLPAPKVLSHAPDFSSDYRAAFAIDGKPGSEWAAQGSGTNAFLEFDFGAPVRIAGFRHQDRDDPATVAASELVLSDGEGKALGTVGVTHVNQRGGVTLFALAEPVTAQRVRWRVTRLGSIHGTVGAAEIAFFTAGEPEATPSGITLEARGVPVLERQGGALLQPVRVTLDHPYARPAEVTLQVQGREQQPLRLQAGSQSVVIKLSAVETERSLPIALVFAGQTLTNRTITLKPVRRTTIYLLPHSHTDIGYTEIQSEIEDKQVNNLLLGMEHAQRTAGYPPGARFVWNVEVLWAADLYLRRLSESQRARFLEAVKRGQVALCGMYLNELTGLCRPEELVRLFRQATELGQRTGVPIDSAMISDVPGYTWGTVTAMAQAGIKYFSVAPNYFDRIGDILVQWENKPFWWIAPDGQAKVLVWIPYKGYAMSHIYNQLTPGFVEHYQDQLDATAYPYDIAYIRWSGHGDNATPDPAICEFVKEWDAGHAWPKFVIASVSDAFRAFERKYGDKLVQARGDWTPYWEDGAGSSALETGMNRASSDRLGQAATVWAMRHPRSYPAGDFEAAWRNVLLYSEHTWGAWCSVGEPARRETREQWAIKQGYAVAADLESRALLSRGLGLGQAAADEAGFDVLNTSSWTRSDLVTVPKYLCESRDRVTDDQGAVVPSQRLRNGELVFVARDVPPFATRHYLLAAGPLQAEAAVAAQGTTITNRLLTVRVDEATGGVVELRASGIDINLADTSSGQALNEYLYLIGDNAADARRNGKTTVRVGEQGPVVASLLVESEAPGCHKLTREVRVVAGMDYVELIDLVDKQRLVAASYHAKAGKESLNFAFPFNVPGGEVLLDVPFGVVRPGTDQIPSACKNWFTVGRWADVSNAEFGVTWVTLDAPLVQVGGLTATLLNSQTNPDVWRKEVEPTRKLYSWAMNNHWGTNYRACQEGPTVFRFILRPHRGRNTAEASRLAMGFGQPLLATGARAERGATKSRLTLSSPDVVVTGFKPSDDGKALIVRLWEATGRETQTRVTWGEPAPRRVWLSDTSEKPLHPAGETVRLPGWGLVTLRAELP